MLAIPARLGLQRRSKQLGDFLPPLQIRTQFLLSEFCAIFEAIRETHLPYSTFSSFKNSRQKAG